MAEVLGLKETEVRFVKPAVGGGFGARQQLHSQPVIALMSKKLRRPVKCIYTREEEFTAAAVRLGSEVDIEISVDEDGTLETFETYYLANIGPYTVHGPTIVAGASRKVEYASPTISLTVTAFSRTISAAARSAATATRSSHSGARS